MKILVINPGSTSTKVAYYVDGEMVAQEMLNHRNTELSGFETVMDQIDFRRSVLMDFMKEEGIHANKLDAVVGRGGLLPPMQSGAYEVNDAMLDYLKYHAVVDHPSNLGAVLAQEIKNQAGGKTIALIYDPVSVDEYDDISRISGLAGVPRTSLGHALNSRAVAMDTAEKEGLDFLKSNIIVAHLGGGNTISILKQGRMVDSISDDQGPFSTERTGGLPTRELIRLSADHDPKELTRMYRREGGWKSYAGTNDLRDIQKRIDEGNKELAIVFDAYAYQIAQAIAGLSVAANGEINRIVLTGGAAHSKHLVDEIKQRVSFLAPVNVEAGEHEMIALAKGAERIVRQQEKMHEFKV